MSDKIYDLVVIGGGPVGLYSTFMAQYLKLSVVCLEKDEHVGGQLAKLYPSKSVHDFPTHNNITAQEIINKFKDQINPDFIHTNIDVFKYEIIDDVIKLVTTNGNSFYCRNILFAVGPGAFEFVKVDESLLNNVSNKKINYVFNHYKNNVDNLDVIIFGGGDSALDYAYEIAHKHNANSVTLVHRSPNLRGISHTIDDLREKDIKVFLNTNINQIDSKYCYLEQDQQKITLPYDFLLFQFGVSSIGSNIHQWMSFEKQKNRFIVNENYETNIPNFYAAGNCCYREFKIDMIMTGIAEATIALNHIHYKIKKTNKPEY